MKYFLFAFIVLLQVGQMAAQCPNNATDDVRTVYLDFEFASTGYGFTVNPCRLHSLHNQVQFIPKFENEYSNGNWNDKTFWCDPGDGTPKFEMKKDEIVVHVYPVNTGNTLQSYALAFEMRSSNGTVLQYDGPYDFLIKPVSANNSASVPSSYLPPDEVWAVNSSATFEPPAANAFPAGSQYNTNTTGGGHAYVKFAQGHGGKLIRPLIFVDGIDFSTTTYTYDGNIIRHGSTGWDVLVMGNDASAPNPFDINPETGLPTPSEFKYYPTAIRTLLEEEHYDIVFMDFTVGADYIQKNGLVLVKLLQMINERKAQDATKAQPACDNVILGASMGGQVAKWALSYMEENGLDHQCHTYVSFDSPQRGAHIPLPIQAFAYLAYLTGQDSENLWGRLQSPAARQMLIATLTGSQEGGTTGLGDVSINIEQYDACTLSGFEGNLPVEFGGFGNTLTLRQGFAGEIGALGYPKNTRNIAISCGSSNGTKQSFDDGEEYFNSKRTEDPPNIACGHSGDVLGVSMAAIPGGATDPGTILAFCAPNGLGGAGCSTIPINELEGGLFSGFIPFEYDMIAGNDVPQKYKLLEIANASTLPSLDNAPGCKRGDLLTIQNELVKAGATTTVNAGYTTFMPTLSLLDIQWPMDNEHLVMALDKPTVLAQNLTPFDDYYAPSTNLRHIELTEEMLNFVTAQLPLGEAAAGQPLLLSAGQTYNYGKRKNRVPDVEIPANARLTVNTVGRINYQMPGDPEADETHFEVFTGGGCSPNKTITVKQDGLLQIGDEQNAEKTGILHVLKGSTVVVESGGILRIFNASELRIYDGATLIIKAGAIIQLNDPAAMEDGAAVIKIEPGGALLVEGEFDLSGNGYFWLQGKGEKFPLYDDLRTTIRWEGEGKNVRRLFLDEFTWHTENKVVIIKSMQADCRGVGSLDALNCDVRLVDAQIQGVELALQGVVATGGTFVAQDVDFFHFPRALALVNMPNASIAYPYINACHFDDCNIGLLAQNLKQLNVRGSQFTQCAGAAMALFGVHSLAHIAETIITGSGAGTIGTANDLQEISQQSPPYYAIVDPLTDAVEEFGHNNWGVYAHDVTRFRMTGGVIEDCEQGVYSPTGSRSNFVFSSHAVIQNNRAGIHIQEGYKETSGDAHQFFGMVMLDCAKLLDNHVGILGVNALLQMDAFSNSGTTNPLYVCSNHFRRISNAPATEINRLFHICYAPEYGISQIQARGNYWQNLTNSSADWRLRTAGDNTQCFANNGNGLFPLVINPIANATPTGCPAQIIAGPGTPGPGPQPQDPDECAAPPDSELDEKIGVYFYQAYKTYSDEAESTGDFAGSDALFQKVANLKDEEVELLNENCRKYVRISRAFVQATPGGKPDKPEERSSGMYGEQSIHLQPNPAHEVLLVTIDTGNRHILRLWNAYGSLVREMPVEAGQSKIDTENLPGGIYLLEVETAGIHTFKKVIIQH